MQLTLAPKVDLNLDFHFARDNVDREHNDLGSYQLTGPKAKCDMLVKVGVEKKDGETFVKGKLSPVAPLSIPEDVRHTIGVPLGATHFAFAYPGVDWTGESLEERLEKMNLANELWAFFLLVGGFCYFVEDPETGARTLVQINALVLVPSEYTMDFDGPHKPLDAALHALHVRNRLVDVTLDVLEDAGFAAFGWVMPSELPGGTMIVDDIPYPHGGFLYEMTNDRPPTFFALQEPRATLQQGAMIWVAMVLDLSVEAVPIFAPRKVGW